MTRSSLTWPTEPQVWVSVVPRQARLRVPVHMKTGGGVLRVSFPKAVQFVHQFVLELGEGRDKLAEWNDTCNQGEQIQTNHIIAVIFLFIRPTFHLPFVKILKTCFPHLPSIC